MSERVSRVADAVLDEWADGRISPVNSMADELRRFREVAESPRWIVQTLAAWEALGESPESVRAELERLRDERDRMQMRAMSVPIPAAQPTFDVPPNSHLARPPRPTPLEALYTEIVGRRKAPATTSDLEFETLTLLMHIVRNARRAAGEVL